MNGNQATRPELTLRDVLFAVFRHRKKAMACFLLVMTATVAVTFLMPKAYMSEAKLFVRLGRENAMLDSTATLGNNPVVALPSSRESEINSVAEMLASRAILERVVDEVGPGSILDDRMQEPSGQTTRQGGVTPWLERTAEKVRVLASGVIDSLRSAVSSSSLTPRDQALELLGKRLAAEPVRKSNVVRITCEAGQPELAQQVVASAVNAYLDEHVRLNRTSGTHEFFAEHAKRLGDDLERLEGELGNLKTATGLTSVDEQRTQIVTRIGRLEDELLTAQAARAEAETKVAALRAKLAELPKEQVLETNTGIGNQGTDLIREKFFSLQVAEREAASIYTANHPKLQMIREELAEAARIMAEQEPTRTEVKTAPDASYEQTRLALIAEEPLLEALQAKAASLEKQVADVRASLESLNANEIRIAHLRREIELCEADYRKYATNVEEARIDQAMETERMSNISVVQPASFQPRAIWPRKALNLAAGFVLALCTAFAISLLAEMTGRPLRTPEDIQRHTGLPTIASVRRMRSEALEVDVGK